MEDGEGVEVIRSSLPRGTLALLSLTKLAQAPGLMAGAVMAAAAALESVPSWSYQVLLWQLIGPFSGGRTTAVASHPRTEYLLRPRHR
jgi:hypothetical protein